MRTCLIGIADLDPNLGVFPGSGFLLSWFWCLTACSSLLGLACCCSWHHGDNASCLDSVLILLFCANAVAVLLVCQSLFVRRTGLLVLQVVFDRFVVCVIVAGRETDVVESIVP